MDDQNMIERVARAMFRATHDEPWEQGEALTREIFLNCARAAIDAMRTHIIETVPREMVICPEQEHLRGTADFGNYASGRAQCYDQIAAALSPNTEK